MYIPCLNLMKLVGFYKYPSFSDTRKTPFGEKNMACWKIFQKKNIDAFPFKMPMAVYDVVGKLNP